MSQNGKGSKRRPGKPGAYGVGWDRVFARKSPRKKDSCCGKSGCTNPPDEEHICPYQEDINNNRDFTCTCCADCRWQCAQDI